MLLGAALFSAEGFESGYFIGVVDADVAQDEDGKLQWPVCRARGFVAA